MIEIEKISHLTGHTGAIYCLENYGESYFFSGGFDNLVVKWNIDNPDNAVAVARLNSKAISLLYIKEKNWLVAGQSTGGVHIIDLESKKEIHLIQSHEEMVFALCYDSTINSLFIGAADGKISLWEFDTMKTKKIRQLQYGKVREIKISNDLLYIGTESGSVVIVNKDFIEVGLIDAHIENFSVNTLTFYKDRLVSGSRDGHLNEFRLKKNIYELIQKIPAHNYAVYKTVISPDGLFFATASRDKSIKIWNSNDISFIMKIDFKNYKGHTGSVNDLLWIGDNLISVSDDRAVIVWKVKYLSK